MNNLANSSITFEPQNFFIGLMDSFSILLPGTLLTSPLIGEVGLVVLGNRLCEVGNHRRRLFNPTGSPLRPS